MQMSNGVSKKKTREWWQKTKEEHAEYEDQRCPTPDTRRKTTRSPYFPSRYHRNFFPAPRRASLGILATHKGWVGRCVALFASACDLNLCSYCVLKPIPLFIFFASSPTRFLRMGVALQRTSYPKLCEKKDSTMFIYWNIVRQFAYDCTDVCTLVPEKINRFPSFNNSIPISKM